MCMLNYRADEVQVPQHEAKNQHINEINRNSEYNKIKQISKSVSNS